MQAKEELSIVIDGVGGVEQPSECVRRKRDGREKGNGFFVRPLGELALNHVDDLGSLLRPGVKEEIAAFEKCVINTLLRNSALD